jgi:hypothetical protein
VNVASRIRPFCLNAVQKNAITGTVAFIHLLIFGIHSPIFFLFSLYVFWRTSGPFFTIFFLCYPLTEVSPRPSAIPGGNPPGDGQSAVGWGDAGFEPGTAGQLSGALPLSHHASLLSHHASLFLGSCVITSFFKFDFEFVELFKFETKFVLQRSGVGLPVFDPFQAIEVWMPAFSRSYWSDPIGDIPVRVLYIFCVMGLEAGWPAVYPAPAWLVFNHTLLRYGLDCVRPILFVHKYRYGTLEGCVDVFLLGNA